MNKTKILILALILIANSVKSQTDENYSDKFLTSSFKIYESADFELAYHIAPFLKKRFIDELKDTSSFSNPYDSLSKYIDIKYSSDSLLKTYCWSERNGSCCHTSATFAQFRTKSGNINYKDLEDPVFDDGKEIFITDLQLIEIQDNPYYMILGWGTCCGGKHYCLARVYEIRNDSLIKCDSIFNNEAEIFVGANRGQEIRLKYSAEQRILSYNSYKFNEDHGFYEHTKAIIVEWKLTKTGFQRIN